MSAPLTPMEQGGTWATLEEGDAFLDDCEASGRVVSLSPGLASDGTPMRVVIVSAGLVVPQAAQLLVVASQHGQERSSREAALRWIRDMAFAPDGPAVTVAVIPTANPYGTVNVTRYNANGADINRSHVDLSTPEARAIHWMLKASPTLLVYDGHDTASRTSAGKDVPGDVNFLSHKQTVAPPFANWSLELYDRLGGLYTVPTGIYPLADHEGTLTNCLGSVGFPNVLVETKSVQADETRVQQHMTAMAECLKIVAETASELAAVREQSAAWARGEGFTAHAPIFLYENGYQTAPAGYVMPVSEVPSQTLALHGIRTLDRWGDSTDVYVPMDQDAYALIPWLLDPRSPRPVTSAAVPVFPGDEAAVDLLPNPDRELMLPNQFRWGGRVVRRLVTADGMIWGT